METIYFKIFWYALTIERWAKAKYEISKFGQTSEQMNLSKRYNK